MKNDRPEAGDRSTGELNGRKVILGVCGGIAAYKAVELVRLLMKAGARVQVIMTDSATKFVAPLAFEAITGRNVFVEMFPSHGEISPWHTEIATWADLVVVAPATANHMARLASGMADDLLSTTLLTVERPKVLCPAMNPRMWANPATQENLATLKRRGYRVVMPEEGTMARPGEDDGVGRLAEPDTIFREVRHILSAPQDLRGVRVLVTAGRTEESWDPVRMLTNRASGRMGFALAEEARERGADVILIHGPTDVVPPTGVRVRSISTAAEMAAAVKQEVLHSQVVLMAAAVSDYTFSRTAPQKIKKGDPRPEVNLVPTEDILRSISGQKGNRIIVGFAMETENLLENALRKLRDKHLDIVVANNPLSPGSGFAGETNQVLIIHRGGRVTDLPLKSKREVAREILNAVIGIFRNPEPEPETEVIEDDAAGLAALWTEDGELDEAEPADNLPVPESESAQQAAGKRPRGRRGGRRSRARKAAQHSNSGGGNGAPPSAPIVVPPVVAPAPVEVRGVKSPAVKGEKSGQGQSASRKSKVEKSKVVKAVESASVVTPAKADVKKNRHRAPRRKKGQSGEGA